MNSQELHAKCDVCAFFFFSWADSTPFISISKVIDQHFRDMPGPAAFRFCSSICSFSLQSILLLLVLLENPLCGRMMGASTPGMPHCCCRTFPFHLVAKSRECNLELFARGVQRALRGGGSGSLLPCSFLLSFCPSAIGAEILTWRR